MKSAFSARRKSKQIRPTPTRNDSSLSIHQTSKSQCQPVSLLTLPAELRLQIYSYLMPPARLPTVIRARESLGVSSLTHKPPPLALLLANSLLCEEALDLYYRRVSFEIEGLLDADNAWPLWQVEQVLGGSPVLGRMRRLELNLYWHRIPSGNGRRETEELVRRQVCKRTERMQRVVDVLILAVDLREVVICWKENKFGEDMVASERPGARAEVLAPLSRLGGLVKLRVGHCIAGEEVSMEVAQAVREYDLVSHLVQ